MASKCSIALCTYKGSRFLEQQLESFVRQTRHPDELVIVDDNSPDRTVEIAINFAKTAPFLTRVLRNEANVGPAENFARALKECRHPIVFFSDQDDVWLKEKVQTFLLAFDDDKVLAVASDARLADVALEPMRGTLWQSMGFKGDPLRMQQPALLDYLLRRGNFIAGMSLAVRRDFALEQLPLPRGWLHDGWLSLMAAHKGSLKLINEELALYRQHDTNVVGVPSFSKLQFTRLLAAAPRIDLHESYDQTESAIARLGQVIASDQRDYLNNRLTHLRRRLDLPRMHLLRIPTIAAELLSGNYHEFSAGYLGAARDALRLIGSSSNTSSEA